MPDARFTDLEPLRPHPVRFVIMTPHALGPLVSWWLTDANGVESPLTFATRAEAETALTDDSLPDDDNADLVLECQEHEDGGLTVEGRRYSLAELRNNAGRD